MEANASEVRKPTIYKNAKFLGSLAITTAISTLTRGRFPKVEIHSVTEEEYVLFGLDKVDVELYQISSGKLFDDKGCEQSVTERLFMDMKPEAVRLRLGDDGHLQELPFSAIDPDW